MRPPPRREWCDPGTVRLHVLALLALASCNSTDLVLKQPLVMGCHEAHIPPASCPDLADGVIAYINEDKEAAERKIRRAVAAAAPGDVRKFIKALEALDSLPGSDSFMGPVREVIAMLDGTAPSTDGPAAPGQAATAEDDAAELVQKHPKFPELGATRPEAKLTCEHEGGYWLDQGAKVGCKIEGVNIFACALADDSTVTACTHWKLGAEVADERDALSETNGKPTAVSLGERGFRTYAWETPRKTVKLTGYGAGVIVTETAKAPDETAASK